MERIEDLIEKKLWLKQALASYKKAILLYKDLKHDDKWYATSRDSIIKNFEFNTDTFWKVLKYIMEHEYGLNPDPSPKKIVISAYKNNILTESDYLLIIEMIDDRNRTSHIHNEIQIETIAQRILEYLPKFENIVNKITQ